jgi:CRISPR/Cas system-associated exonuclease Cas4 (RecB family)
MSLKNLAKLVKQATQSDMTPAKEFQNYLNQAIVMLEKENRRQPSQTYKPSSLGGCMRMNYFQVTGAPLDVDSDIDADFVGICESGTDRHERIQNAVIEMKRLGIQCEWVDVEKYLTMYPQPGTELVSRQGNEFKLRNTILNMSFLCDGIIKFGGKYYILEIKTEVSFKWSGRTDAEEKHKVQASAYSTCLGIDDILFVYEQRDLCKKKFIHILVTQEDKEEKVIHYINTCQDYVERGEVPPKSELKSDCTYCNFKEECKKW